MRGEGAAAVAHWDSLPDLLTVDELAAALRIGRNTAYELTHQAGFPALKLGRRRLVPKAALARWLEDQAAGPPSLDRLPAPANGRAAKVS